MARSRAWWWAGGALVLLGGGAAALGAAYPRQARALLRKLPGSVAGMAQPKTTARGARVRWPKGPLTLTIDGSMAAAAPGGDEAVKAAAGAWLSSGAALPDLAFDTSSGGGPKKDGVNGVYVAPITLAGHEKDVAITISYVEEGSGRLVEADVVLNAAYRFAVLASDAPAPAPTPEPAAAPPPEEPPPEPAVEAPVTDATGEAAVTVTMKVQRVDPPPCAGSYDVQTVAAHELGHFFGLGEDTSNAEAVMFYKLRACGTSKRALSADDVAVIGTHYEGEGPSAPGSPAPDGGAGGCGRVARGRDASPWAVLGLLGLALAARVSRRR